MRILFMGTPDIAAASLAAILEAGHEVCGVFTRQDKPVGRKQVLTAPPVKVLAESKGIPVYQPRTLRDEAVQADIRALAPYLQSMPTGHVSTADLLQLKELVYDARVTIGASGAIFGVLLAFAMLFPDARIFLLFIPIPIRAPYFVAFYALCELFMGVQDFHGDNVAHFAHLGGMIFGLILILYWKKKKNINGSSSYY